MILLLDLLRQAQQRAHALVGLACLDHLNARDGARSVLVNALEGLCRRVRVHRHCYRLRCRPRVHHERVLILDGGCRCYCSLGGRPACVHAVDCRVSAASLGHAVECSICLCVLQILLEQREQRVDL